MNAGIRLLGTSHVEKTTDGTRRTTLRENPDVESGESKELITLRIQCTTHMNETRPHMVPVRKESAQLIWSGAGPGRPGSALARLPSHATRECVASLAVPLTNLRPKRRRAAALQRVALRLGASISVPLFWSALARLRFGRSLVTRYSRMRSFVGSPINEPQAKAAPGRRTPKSCAPSRCLYFGASILECAGPALARLPSHATRECVASLAVPLTNLRPKRRRAAALQRAALQSWRDFKPSQRAFQTQ